MTLASDVTEYHSPGLCLCPDIMSPEELVAACCNDLSSAFNSCGMYADDCLSGRACLKSAAIVHLSTLLLGVF